MSTKIVKIYFIYAENCRHSQAALSAIESAVVKCNKIPCEIIKLLYNNDEALRIAIEHNIDDLPGFVIGSEIFKGKNHDAGRIVKAIGKASR